MQAGGSHARLAGIQQVRPHIHARARLARMPGGAVTRRSTSMTPAQVAALLSSDLPPLWWAWVTTAVSLGLRPGELAALA